MCFSNFKNFEIGSIFFQENTYLFHVMFVNILNKNGVDGDAKRIQFVDVAGRYPPSRVCGVLEDSGSVLPEDLALIRDEVDSGIRETKDEAKDPPKAKL